MTTRVMTTSSGGGDAQIQALLDAHDALVACLVDGTLSPGEFIGSYGNFPRDHGLEDLIGTGSLPPISVFRRRMAFHRQVASIVSGPAAASGGSIDDPLGDYIKIAIGRRIRELVARHPDFQAGAELRDGIFPG